MEMSDEYRATFCIIYGELNGSKFDYKAWKWTKPKDK